MWTTIECAGHPRDLGGMQGAATRHAIRSELARAGLSCSRSRMPTLRGLASGPLRGRGAGREFYRHFAHQAERLEGLAAAAGVPSDSILALHLLGPSATGEVGLLSRGASLRGHWIEEEDAASLALLERTLPEAVTGEAGWMLRESRPEVGFPSIEVGLPWLVSSVAGLNAGGLAMMAGPSTTEASGRDGAAPALLLVQECLQRFSDVEGALGWCQKRPVEGEQSFVLADASGAIATVVLDGRECRIEKAEAEIFLPVGQANPSNERVAAVSGDVSRLDRIRLDPRRRRLEVDVAGTAIQIDLKD
ncbi:MAG: hypothetical protein VCB25_04990 [Myxococcota bacterium]